jgi:hypothetical protein
MAGRSALFLCALLLNAAAAREPVADAAGPLLGCWRNVEDPKLLARFEKERVIFQSEGRLRVFSAGHEPGRVSLYSRGRTNALPWRIEEGRLVLETPSGPQAWERLEGVPAELELRPRPLGEPDAVAPGRIAAVSAELAKRREADQAVRTDPSRRGEMRKVDADNTAWLIGLIAELGWIDSGRFGASAANDAFLIVQHSGDLRLMLAALPEIERDVSARTLDPQPYALLYDRLQLNLGRKQRYGTQIGRNRQGDLVVLPLEDRERVEEFRKQIGLFPLSAYLDMFRRQSGKAVGFMDDDEPEGTEEKE